MAAGLRVREATAPAWTETLNEEGWAGLVLDAPTVAAWLWGYKGQVDLAEEILRGLLRQPQSLFRYPNLWAEFDAFVPALRDELRGVLRTVAPTIPPFERYYRQKKKRSPLRLKLPEDVSLLPHLAAELLSVDVFHHVSTEDELQDVGELVRATVGAIANVRRIYQNETHDSQQRLGAVVFAWLHPAGKRLAEPIPAITPLVTAVNARWFVPTAASILIHLGSPHEVGAVQIAAQLINSVRDNFRDRDLLDKVISRWREISRGPATDAKLIESWIRT